jgi:hypothetical protein
MDPRHFRVINNFIIAKRIETILTALAIPQPERYVLNLAAVYQKCMRYDPMRCIMPLTVAIINDEHIIGCDEDELYRALESMTRFYPNDFYDRCASIKRNVTRARLERDLRPKFIKDICAALPAPIFDELGEHI